MYQVDGIPDEVVLTKEDLEDYSKRKEEYDAICDEPKKAKLDYFLNPPPKKVRANKAGRLNVRAKGPTMIEEMSNLREGRITRQPKKTTK